VSDGIRLIEDFYRAFARRDHRAMAALYRSDAQFSDPVFTDLRGAEIGAMWRMLVERGNDLELELTGIECDGRTVFAQWEAKYTFSGTGRRVHNRVRARFQLEDGVVTKHVDEFDFYAWSRMALGPTGWFLGWTPLVKNKVRGRARRALDQFIAAKS
jgi:limonene-1,2-epoxide hydrolase